MIPGAHILPCPECGVPVDASEADNFNYYDKMEHFTLNNQKCFSATIALGGLWLECHNCYRETISGKVVQLLEAKDGHKRGIILKMIDEETCGLAIDFENENRLTII